MDEEVSRLASLRAANGGLPILHASISCKWTIRSDRVQNARSEALNLIRNRKGKLPHVAVVTGEPLPSRLSAIALGTGDIDCVYHFALPELVAAVEELGHADSAGVAQDHDQRQAAQGYFRPSARPGCLAGGRHGQAFSRTPQCQHAAHPQQRYEPGACCFAA